MKFKKNKRLYIFTAIAVLVLTCLVWLSVFMNTRENQQIKTTSVVDTATAFISAHGDGRWYYDNATGNLNMATKSGKADTGTEWRDIGIKIQYKGDSQSNSTLATVGVAYGTSATRSSGTSGDYVYDYYTLSLSSLTSRLSKISCSKTFNGTTYTNYGSYFNAKITAHTLQYFEIDAYVTFAIDGTQYGTCTENNDGTVTCNSYVANTYSDFITLSTNNGITWTADTKQDILEVFGQPAKILLPLTVSAIYDTNNTSRHDAIAKEDGNVTMSVDASGGTGSYTYQWYAYNPGGSGGSVAITNGSYYGVTISGAKTNTITISNVTSTGISNLSGHELWCKVTDTRTSTSKNSAAYKENTHYRMKFFGKTANTDTTFTFNSVSGSSYTTGKWTNKDVFAKVTASTPGWGVTRARISYSSDGSNAAAMNAYDSAGDTITSTVTSASYLGYTISTEGIHNVTIKAYNGTWKAGGTYDATDLNAKLTVPSHSEYLSADGWVSAGTVKIDKTAPTVTVSKSGNILTATATDALSGVKSYSWKEKDGSTVLGTKSTLEVEKEGTYVVTVTDYAGNTSTKQISVTDVVPEFVYVRTIQDKTEAPFDTYYVSMKLSSNGTDIESLEYSKSTDSGETWSDWKTWTSFPSSTNDDTITINGYTYSKHKLTKSSSKTTAYITGQVTVGTRYKFRIVDENDNLVYGGNSSSNWWAPLRIKVGSDLRKEVLYNNSDATTVKVSAISLAGLGYFSGVSTYTSSYCTYQWKYWDGDSWEEITNNSSDENRISFSNETSGLSGTIGEGSLTLPSSTNTAMSITKSTANLDGKQIALFITEHLCTEDGEVTTSVIRSEKYDNGDGTYSPMTYQVYSNINFKIAKPSSASNEITVNNTEQSDSTILDQSVQAELNETLEATPYTTGNVALTGWTFNGWYRSNQQSASKVYNADGSVVANSSFDGTDSGGNATTYQYTENGKWVHVVKSTTLVSNWTANTYTVTYNSNKPSDATEEVTGSTADSTHTYDTENTLTANGYSLTGWKFTGWNTKADGTGTAYADGVSVKNLTAEKDTTVTLYAQWTPITYTVVYDANKATFDFATADITGSTPSSTHTYDTAQNFSSNGYSLEGWNFVCWYNAEKAIFGFEGIPVKNLTATDGETITMYAMWTPITYTVTYDANKPAFASGEITGTTADSKHAYDYDDPENAITELSTGGGFAARLDLSSYDLKLTDNGYSLPGWTFTGWNTEPDGSGTSYEDGEAIKNLTTTANSTITLYAQWTTKNYTVEYNKNNPDATGTTANQAFFYEETKKLNESGFTSPTYTVTFDGNGGSTPAAMTSTQTQKTTGAWRMASASAGLEYDEQQSVSNLAYQNVCDLNNDGVTNDADVTILQNHLAEAELITDADLLSLADFNGDSVVNTTDLFVLNQYVSGTVRLYAQWNERTAVTLPTPTRTGYTFNGWYTAASDGTKVGDGGDSYTPSEDVTLYAQWTANGHTVSYNANGGSSTPATQSGAAGTNITLADAITRDSETLATYRIVLNKNYTGSSDMTSIIKKQKLYTFNGWAENSVSGTNYAAGANYVIPDADTVMYATWETSTSSYSITLPNVSRTGYTFEGWYTAASGGTRIGGGGTAYTPTASDTTLYAQWTPITYTVTYVANKPSSASNSVTGVTTKSTHVYDTAKALTSNGFTLTGWTFTGWNTKADGSGTNYANSASVKNLTAVANSTVTLYAQWKANTYTVSYNANKPDAASGSVSGSTASSTHTYDSAAALTANGFSLGGWGFNGWNTKADGTGTAYENGAAVKNLTSVAGSTVVLYAQWTASTRSVSYDANGGASTPATQSGVVGETITLAEAIAHNPASVIDGTYTVTYNYNGNGEGNTIATATKTTVYAFNKWAENSESGTRHEAGSEFVIPNTDTIMYATWTLHTNTTTVTLPSPTRTGYVFDGWYTEANGGTKIGEADSVYTPTEDVTMFAHWVPITYTVVYDSNKPATASGDIVGTTTNSTHTYDTVKDLTVNGYTLTGWTFNGWNTNADGSGTSYANGASVKNLTTAANSAVTLYAQWTVNTYTVAYNANKPADATGSVNGTMGNSSCTYEIEQKLPANNYSLDGWVFKGWNTKADGSGTAYADEEVVSNLTAENGATVTLYAQWEAKTYTVTYNTNKPENATYSPEVLPGSMTVSFDAITPNAAIPTLTGWHFAGWYTGEKDADENLTLLDQLFNADGTAVKSVSGYTDAAGKWIFNGDLTVYAKWIANTYTVKYDKNNAEATGSTASQTFTYDSAQALNDSGFVSPTYTVTFDSNGGSDVEAMTSKQELSNTGIWRLNDATTGHIYDAYEYAYNLTETDGGIVTMYAQWKTREAIELPTAEKDGYVLSGWYTAENGGTKVGNAGDSYTPTANTTLYAQWEAETVAVSYDANGGTTTPATQNAPCDSSITLAGEISRNKSIDETYTVTFNYNGNGTADTNKKANKTTTYTFDKWAEGSAEGTKYAAGANYKVPALDVTMFATWTTSTNTASVTLPTPTRTGFTFDGWYTAASGGTKIGAGGAAYTPTVSITLFAHWIPDSLPSDYLKPGKLANVYMLQDGTGVAKASVTGSGAKDGNYTFTWQYSLDEGTTWSTIPSSKNGTTFSGVTTNTLHITNAQPWLNQVLLRCMVKYGTFTVYCTAQNPKGDLNFNGVVNDDDVTLLTEYLNGNATCFNSVRKMYEAADMNRDNAITAADKTALQALTGSEAYSTYARFVVYGKVSAPTVAYTKENGSSYTTGTWTKDTVNAIVSQSALQGAGVNGLKTYNGEHWTNTESLTVEFEETGKYTFAARSYNVWYPGTDNIADSATVEIRIDKTAPTATSIVSSNVYDDDTGEMVYTVWANGAKDAHSGLHATAYSFSTTKGTYSWQATNSLKNADVNATYYVYIRDAVGNILLLNATGYKIPHLPDAFASDWLLCEGDNSSKTATIVNSTGSAAYRWEYLDGTTWRAIPEGVLKKTTFSDTDEATLQLENAAGVLNGTKFRIVITENGSQIISEPKSNGEWPQITVVGKPTTPAITGKLADDSSYTEGTWTNSSSVTLTASGSTITGAGTLKYQKATGASVTTWTDGSAANANETFASEGVFQWNARAVSTYESLSVNSDVATFRVKIDRTAPAIDNTDISDTPTKKGDGTTVTVTAHDDTSKVGGDATKVAGLADKAYSYDGGETWESDATHVYHENGTYSVWVKDVAGNIAKKTITISNLYPDKDTLIENMTDLTGVTFGTAKYQALDESIHDYEDTLTAGGKTYNGLALHFKSELTINRYAKCHATLLGTEFTGAWSDGKEVATKASNDGVVVIDGTLLGSNSRKNVVLTLVVESYSDAACTALVNTETKQIIVNVDTVGPEITYTFDAYTGEIEVTARDALVGLQQAWYDLHYTSGSGTDASEVHFDTGSTTATVKGGTATMGITAVDLLGNTASKTTKDLTSKSQAGGGESDDTGAIPSNYPDNTQYWKSWYFYCYLVNGND